MPPRMDAPRPADDAVLRAGRLAHVLTGLLPREVASATAPCTDRRLRHSTEAALVERAVDKRRREFATGRHLAHELLAHFDVADAPLLPGERRAPLWPPGVVGSISHTRELCVAAVARADHTAFLGLDLEGAEPLERDLWRRILTPDERAWAEAAADEAARGRRAKLVFSAKECVYKALAPVMPRVLEFLEVGVDCDVEAGRFSVSLLPADVAADPARLRGRCWADGRDLLTILAVPAA